MQIKNVGAIFIHIYLFILFVPFIIMMAQSSSWKGEDKIIINVDIQEDSSFLVINRKIYGNFLEFQT